MSALAQPSQLNTSTDSVTSISVNARIDYILRFSKHAILVVDESAEECSSVGYQFLDQLSPEHNAAFVSASTKLNNIQIRCRIIEQLFSSSVFDPEQSLAVSIVNLLNANPQKLAIVIDNVQFASLQIIHELTQLALIAKKAKLDIELLMLGDYAAGKMLAAHKDLFHKKISILSKQSGQLLSLSAKEFKMSQSWLTLTVSKKWLIALTSISLLAIMTVVWLQQQETFSYSNLPATPASNKALGNTAEQTVLTVGAEKINSSTADILESQLSTTASSEHIYNVLLGNIRVNKTVPAQAAQISDIVSAIAAFKTSPSITRDSTVILSENKIGATRILPSALNDNKIFINTTNASDNPINKKALKVPTTETRVAMTKNNKSLDTIVVNPIAKETTILANMPSNVSTDNPLGNEYFKGFTRGFVVQIAGFTQESIKEEFLADFTNIEFKQYQRLLNDETMTVLTSKYYATRAQAEQALYLLPETILARSPWIKSISAINNEINAFERSQ